MLRWKCGAAPMLLVEKPMRLVNGVQEQEKRNVWQSAHSKLKWAQLHAHASFAWPNDFDEDTLRNRWQVLRRWVSRNHGQPAKEVDLNTLRVLIEQRYAQPHVAPRAPRALLPRASLPLYTLRPHGAVVPSMVPSRSSAFVVAPSAPRPIPPRAPNLNPDNWRLVSDLMLNASTRVLNLPAWATSWDTFVEEFGEAIGKVVVYRRDPSKNTCSLAVNASPKPDRMQASFTRAGGSPRYTVRAWAMWYRRVLVDESWRDEMYYMTDVTPLYNMTKYWPALERLNPWLSLLRDRSSPLSLHSYLAEVCTMAIPDMDPPFYIAPVLPGDEIMIETPPHKDGHGSQSAYHFVSVCRWCQSRVFLEASARQDRTAIAPGALDSCKAQPAARCYWLLILVITG